MRQIAALPYRRKLVDAALDAEGAPARTASTTEILLVTSRDTGRWIIPKGHMMPGLTEFAAAAVEAEEEAGITGVISATPIGTYPYVKALSNGRSMVMTVAVYPLLVTHEADTWKEQHQRTRRWFAVDDAVAQVDEAELKVLIMGFFEG